MPGKPLPASLGPSALETSGPVELTIVPGRKVRPREGQGLAQGYRAEVARPRSPGSLPTPQPVAGVCTSTPHTTPITPAHQQPQQSPAWVSDTYFQAALAVQGLVSEHESLKIKRQIVHFGCNYHLKRPSREKERERRNKGKKISELSIHHGQTGRRREGLWVPQWACQASCPPALPLSSQSQPPSPAPSDKVETGQALGMGPGWVSCPQLCNHHQTAALFGDSVFSQWYLSFT